MYNSQHYPTTDIVFILKCSILTFHFIVSAAWIKEQRLQKPTIENKQFSDRRIIISRSWWDKGLKCIIVNRTCNCSYEESLVFTPTSTIPLTLSRCGGGCVFHSPPLRFSLNNLKTAYIRTQKLFHFFNIRGVIKFCQIFFLHRTVKQTAGWWFKYFRNA